MTRNLFSFIKYSEIGRIISNQADWKRKTTEISLKQFISKPEKNDNMIIIFKVLECFCVLSQSINLILALFFKAAMVAFCILVFIHIFIYLLFMIDSHNRHWCCDGNKPSTRPRQTWGDYTGKRSEWFPGLRRWVGSDVTTGTDYAGFYWCK